MAFVNEYIPDEEMITYNIRKSTDKSIPWKTVQNHINSNIKLAKEKINSIQKKNGTASWLATQTALNLYDRYFVYYPLKHAGKGTWISVTYDKDSNTFTKTVLGDDWCL